MTDQLRTPAIEALEAAGIPFRVVRTEIARSAEESAAFQGIPVGSLLRSILVRRAQDDFLFVLVPGGRRFNWPKLRQLLGTNRLTLPTEDEAKAETGYVRGAITPFGARRPCTNRSTSRRFFDGPRCAPATRGRSLALR